MNREPLICLDPTNPPKLVHRSTAARRDSLDNAVIGLVSNTLGRSQDLLMAVYHELVLRAQGVQALEIVKPNKSVPPTPEDWARLTSGASVAITGFGG